MSSETEPTSVMDADPDSLNLTTAVDAHAHAVVNCNPHTHTPAAATAGNVANAETAGGTMPPIPPASNPNGYACVITCLIHADSTSPSSIEHANSRGFRLRKTLKSDPVSSENTAACLARSIVEDQYNHAYLHAISQDLVHRYGTAGSGSGSANGAAGKGKPRLNCNITLGYGDGNTTTVMIRQQDDNDNDNAGKVEDEQQDLPVPPPEETDNEASDMPSLDMKSDHDNEAEENGNNAMEDASANNVWVGNLLLLTKLAENGMTSVIQANDNMYQQVQSCSSFPAEIYISPSAAIRDATAPLPSYTQTSSITLITVNSDQAILHVQNKPTKEDIDEFTKHDGDLVTMVIPEITGMPELGESVNHVNMNNVDPTTAAVNAMFTNTSSTNTNTANTLMNMHTHNHPYPHGHHPGAPAAYHPKLPFSMRKKDPNAPKRPLTSYMLFCLDERPKIRKEFPHARVPEIGKALGTRFRNLSEEEMAYYVNKAADLKEKYDQDKAEYYSNVPKGAPGVTPNPNATSEDVLEHYAIGAPGAAPHPYATFAGMDKVPKDPTKPKKPLSVYMLFCKEHRPQVVQENPHMRVPDIGRVLGTMYRKLTEEEMSFYQHRADLLKEQYDRDMAEWKARKAEEEKLGLAGGGGVGVPSMPALPGMMPHGHGHGHHPHSHLAHAYRPPMVGMKRHRTKAPKDPNAPKKPKPSYLIYCSGRRADLREKMPGLTVPETGKILGAEWKNMGPAEKKVFEDLALEDKRRYERQLDEYNRTRTFE